jgi:hypothetical protein
MSFDTRAETRGGWQPGTGGAVGRWLTKRAANQIRRTGKMMGAARPEPNAQLRSAGSRQGRQLAGRSGGSRGTEESGVVSQHRRPSRQGPDRDGRPQDSRDR